MYIQMEYCDKQTLRSAIDEGLYKNTERVWRMFRVSSDCNLHFSPHQD
jgi:translation initiation factor 2-alpha kinase 4